MKPDEAAGFDWTEAQKRSEFESSGVYILLAILCYYLGKKIGTVHHEMNPMRKLLRSHTFVLFGVSASIKLRNSLESHLVL